MSVLTSTSKGVVSGLFFRKPVVILSYDDWSESPEPQMRLLRFLNPKAYRRVQDFKYGKKDCDGIYFPFYINPLTREYEIEESYHSFPETSAIDYIEVTAYIGEYNEVGGYCDKEVTTIQFKDGKKVTLRTDIPNSYHGRSKNFSYNHLVEKLADNKALQAALRRGKVMDLR